MARSSLLMYGDTGTYKTTQIGLAARYIAEVTGKATLLFTSSTDGWASVAEEVEAGMIRPFRCDANVPLPIIRKVSQGYWPDDAEAAKYGAPIERLNFVKADYSEIGCFAFEGYTATSRMIMRHLADRSIKAGQEATSKFTQRIMVDGQIADETFASNSEGHYGFMANVMFGLTAQFQSLDVHLFIGTAHVKRGEDKKTHKNYYGPATEGQITTPVLPTWFGDCLFAEKEVAVVQDGSGKDKVEVKCRYWFTEHPDATTGIIYPAKPRVTHSAITAFRTKYYPDGYFEPTPTSGLDGYLRAIDGMPAQVKDAGLDAWRAKMDQKLGRGRAAAPPAAAGVAK